MAFVCDTMEMNRARAPDLAGPWRCAMLCVKLGYRDICPVPYSPPIPSFVVVWANHPLKHDDVSGSEKWGTDRRAGSSTGYLGR